GALQPWLDGAPRPSQARIAHNLDLRRLYGFFVQSQRHACRLGRGRLFSDLMPAILFVLADCGGGQPAGAARLLLDAAPVASAGGLERDQQAERARSHPENRMTPCLNVELSLASGPSNNPPASLRRRR